SAPSIKNQAPAPTPTAAYRLCQASQSHPAKSKFRNITTSSNGYPQTLRAKAFTRPPSSRLLSPPPPPLFMDPDTQLNLRTLHPEIHLSTVLNLMRCVQLASRLPPPPTHAHTTLKHLDILSCITDHGHTPGKAP
ncbi:hypothetical protein CTAM01_06682, partial [Colletotrichum tamarilloi]